MDLFALHVPQKTLKSSRREDVARFAVNVNFGHKVSSRYSDTPWGIDDSETVQSSETIWQSR
jgi:hypothetical protein